METRNQYIQELDDELIRMTRLIEDLILLSRFDSGRAEIGIEHIDFLGFAENLTGQLRSQAVEKNIDLRFVPSEDGTNRPLVRANLTHLNVVFRNLLDNAIKYTPPGGVVGWRIHTSGQWVISSIQDSGQGISTEQLPHVFDRFYRGDKAHSRQIPGTGLGLSLVKAIVDAYDGKIEVTSLGLEKGTTVTVYWNLFAPSP
jgi:signal transduction histidine kinase